MSQKKVTRSWAVEGMSCASCEAKIEKKFKSLAGVESADASYRTGRVKVMLDPARFDEQSAVRAIANIGYALKESRGGARPGAARGLLIAAALLLFFVVGSRFGLFAFFNVFPEAQEGMGLGMLFVVGLLTSVHCVAMCGGINLSQTLKRPADESPASGARASLLYNFGRVVSYTVIGGIVGALGSAVSLSLEAQAGVQLVAGAFMIIMGLNLMNAFPWLRRLTPSMPKFLARRIDAKREKSNSALYIGLLNGLMPCGPLQAMQLYALSTGSPVKGALSMLMFSLGTVPLMFALGALGSFLSRKSAGRMMAAGAALVAVMGVAMLGNGLGLAGVSIPMLSPKGAIAVADVAPLSDDADAVQIVETELLPYAYPAISVRAGVPVKWTIRAAPGTINGCNNRIFIREYGLEVPLKEGDNVIEFTPDKTGQFTYSCWMGMIRSTITVVDGEPAAEPTAGAADTSPFAEIAPFAPAPTPFNGPVNPAIQTGPILNDAPALDVSGVPSCCQ